MRARVPKELCVECKGVRRLCGARVCPLLLKADFIKERATKSVGREIYGWHGENVFVGESGYPRVTIGPTSMEEPFTPWPDEWVSLFADITDVLRLRLGTLYSFRPQRVDQRIEDAIRELALAQKPVSVELFLRKEPKVRVRMDPDVPPMGMVAPLEKLEVADNVSAPRKLESAVEEDVKASVIVPELFEHQVNHYHIMRLLSAGLLGEKHLRRLVPTRWSITATDSILSDFFLSKLRDYQSISEAELYYREYLGNIYYILLIPSEFWAMEMQEVWLPNTVWVRYSKEAVVIQIWEDYDGRPTKMDGGYYAIRFGVLEHLYRRGRKAAVFALRIVTPRYFAPVGSWQIRESVRKALAEGPRYVGEWDALLEFIDRREADRVGYSVVRKSWLWKRMKLQKRLTEWLKISA